MEKKQLTICGNFNGVDIADYQGLIMDCIRCCNKESFDDIYDNIEVFDDSDNGFNLFPNVEKVVNILEESTEEVPYIIFGNFIVTYDIPLNIWAELDDNDLVPYYGHNLTIADFQNI